MTGASGGLLQTFEQACGRGGHLLHGLVEGRLVCPGRRAVATDLAHELERSRASVVVVRRGFRSTERLDASAHASRIREQAGARNAAAYSLHRPQRRITMRLFVLTLA